MKTVDYENLATITYRDDKILHVKFLKGSSIDDIKAQKIIDASTEISNKELHANLVDTTDMMFMSRAARQVFAKQNRADVLCIAVVINSKLQTLLSNMYLTINAPKILTKMFDKSDDAFNWLKLQISNKENS